MANDEGGGELWSFGDFYLSPKGYFYDGCNFEIFWT